MIPHRFIRSVPEHTTSEIENFWDHIGWLHPGFEMFTYRDPIDPSHFPITSALWDTYHVGGAQLAGLVRLEALATTGGIWLDSDVELYRPLTPLLGCQAFACWEDEHTVPDAVIGAEAQHPAILQCVDLAVSRLATSSDDWRTGNGAWSTGPGVTTTVFPNRADVLLLPPGSFYPYHYTQKQRRGDDHRTNQPWAFGAHHWFGSWL